MKFHCLLLQAVDLIQVSQKRKVCAQVLILGEEEFKEYEKRRVKEIRKAFADGKIPEGYNYTDVPLLGKSRFYVFMFPLTVKL